MTDQQTTDSVTLNQFIEAAVKVGAGEERERIVAWLRREADEVARSSGGYKALIAQARFIADQIERGVHAM